MLPDAPMGEVVVVLDALPLPPVPNTAPGDGGHLEAAPGVDSGAHIPDAPVAGVARVNARLSVYQIPATAESVASACYRTYWTGHFHMQNAMSTGALLFCQLQSGSANMETLSLLWNASGK